MEILFLNQLVNQLVNQQLAQPGFVYADDGTPIVAYKNLSEQDGFDTDCHGQTFAKGQYWIENSEVEELLRGDGYTRIEEPMQEPGDVAIWRNTPKNNDKKDTSKEDPETPQEQALEVTHSAPVVGYYGITIVDSLGGMETSPSRQSVGSLSRYGDVSYYRKREQ